MTKRLVTLQGNHNNFSRCKTVTNSLIKSAVESWISCTCRDTLNVNDTLTFRGQVVYENEWLRVLTARHPTHIPSFGHYNIIRYCCSILKAQKAAVFETSANFCQDHIASHHRRWLIFETRRCYKLI